MRMLDMFAAQLDREAAISQRVLARVPEGRGDWKPHPRSMPLGYLATLVATMPSWLTMTIERDALDLRPPEGGGYKAPAWTTNAELLAIHEESVAKAHAALRGTTEAHLETPWQLQDGGRLVLERPRHVVLADTLTHLAHHRGQLSVYLRLLDVKLPSIYGPSADEGKS